MAILPTPEDQQWVIRNLARLIRTRGPAWFLESPLIEPSDEYFPDPWQPDVEGARSMLRRILAFAGLGTLEVDLVVEEEEADFLVDSGLERKSNSHGTAAWFAGIRGQTCLFGVHEKGLRNAEELAGTLCHEVAHAYRRRHGLEVEGREEEWLTDLTSVFLGFGVFVCNNAYRFRTREHIEGSKVMYGWSAQRIGYLPLELLCFALAAQVVARGTPQARRRVRGLLETNQAAAFEKSCGYLQTHRDVLRVALGLAGTPRNSAEVVHRIEGTRGPFQRLAFWIAAPAICSSPSCRAALPVFLVRCPQCGGQIETAQG
jgi:hypothetical protein